MLKAWPGKLETSYFTFTICWNPFRAFGTSNADFLLWKSGIIQLHFKRLGDQPETKDKRAHCSIKRFYLVGSSETTREYLNKYIFKGKDIVRALMKINDKAYASFNRWFRELPVTIRARRTRYGIPKT